jgi:hypothetical protein
MSSTLASILLHRFVVGSEEQALSVHAYALAKHGRPWPFLRTAGPSARLS